MRADVRPLTYWVIHQQYKVRFKNRDQDKVQGILTTPDGEVDFQYVPADMTIILPDRTVVINDGGWEQVKS